MPDLEYEIRRSGYLMTNRKVMDYLMDLGYTRKTASILLYEKGCPRAPVSTDFIEMWVRNRRTRKHPLTLAMRKAMYFRDQGLSFRDIAERMGVCVATAHRSYTKGRKYELEATNQGKAGLAGLAQM
jgi:CRP-like cAMP-binding protein